MAGAFIAHYGLMMLFSLATPFRALSLSSLSASLRNRVLAPAHAWLYFLNVSRFGVDRRGHFRGIGETTTADLITYKVRLACCSCQRLLFLGCRCAVALQWYTCAARPHKKAHVPHQSFFWLNVSLC